MCAKKMDEIIESLYLTSRMTAQNAQTLEYYKITHILTVAQEIDLSKLASHMSIKYLKIAAEDEEKFPLYLYFDEMADFINESLQNQGRILVHCALGVSRSPSAIMTYLIKYKKKTMDEALKFVKNKRSLVQPNEGFLEQLREYEKKIMKIDGRFEEIKEESERFESKSVYRCKSCRMEVFHNEELVHGKEKKCTSYFLRKTEGDEGKLYCPNEKCKEKIGEVNLSGGKCSCGEWIIPCFRVIKSKIDFIEGK